MEDLSGKLKILLIVDGTDLFSTDAKPQPVADFTHKTKVISVDRFDLIFIFFSQNLKLFRQIENCFRFH